MELIVSLCGLKVRFYPVVFSYTIKQTPWTESASGGRKCTRMHRIALLKLLWDPGTCEKLSPKFVPFLRTAYVQSMFCVNILPGGYIKDTRSSAPRSNFSRCLFSYNWYRYMFRPLLAIFKAEYTINCWKLLHLQQIRVLYGLVLLGSVRIFQTYTRNRNWEILLMLLYLSVSQHVSAPTGHHQVNTITILKHLCESHPLSQRIRCA
jgi:hypothetical protein